MNVETLERLLRDLGIPQDLDHDATKFQVSCPLAPWTHEKGTDNKPSMLVDIGEKMPRYHCFACKSHGWLSTLVKNYNKLANGRVPVNSYFSKFAHLRPGVRRKRKVEPAMPLPEHLMNGLFDFTEYEDAIAYLESRDIDTNVAIEYNIKYDPERDMVVFPVYNARGQFMGAVGRSLQEKRFHNYFHFKTAATLGGIDKLKEPKRIFVVEGWIDLLTAAPWVLEYDGGIVCTWTSRMSAGQAALLSSFDSTIYCLYDSDRAGEEGWQSIVSYFGSISGNRVRRMRLPEGYDVNDITQGEFDSYFEECRKGRLL